jgi:glycosyltransferase involved in cell wall biosynthesis
MERIKVAILVPSLSIGGAEKIVIDLACSIDSDKYLVKLICLSEKKGSSFEKIVENSGLDIVYLNKSLGFSSKTIIKVWKTLSSFKPNIVHTHLGAMIYCTPWAILHKKTVWVHTVHSIAKKELPDIYKYLMKFIYKTHRSIPIAISQNIQTSISDYYKINKDEIPIIYNSVNIKQFYLAEEKSDSEKIALCTVGRMVPVKNHKLLIDSFYLAKKEFKSLSLTIVGDGETKFEIEKQVRNLNLEESIIFVGESNKVSNYLMKGDIYILSSLYEGLPVSLLEAMASGLPIIATDVGGVSDIVEDRVNGILVPSGDTKALSKAIITLAKDKELRKDMSRSSKEKVKKYDLQNMIEEYQDIYSGLVKRKRGPA